jgi:hypothetical protein
MSGTCECPQTTSDASREACRVGAKPRTVDGDVHEQDAEQDRIARHDVERQDVRKARRANVDVAPHREERRDGGQLA